MKEAVFGVFSARACMPSARMSCICSLLRSGVLNETPTGGKRRDFMEHESGELSPARITSGSRSGD